MDFVRSPPLESPAYSIIVLIAHCCLHSGLGLLAVPALLPNPLEQAAPWSG